MRTAANQLEKGILLWSAETGATSIPGGLGSTSVVTATGCAHGVSGFFGKNSYTCTAEDHLVAQGVIPEGFSAKLPSNPHYQSNEKGGRLSMMLYYCGTPGKYAVYWALKNPTSADSSSLDSAISSGCGGAMIRDSWGMRAAKIIQLSP